LKPCHLAAASNDVLPTPHLQVKNSKPVACGRRPRLGAQGKRFMRKFAALARDRWESRWKMGATAAPHADFASLV